MTSESECLPRIQPRVSQRVIGEIIVACIGCALLAAALAADQRWLDRHFLSDFFIPRATFVRVETNARIAVALLGAALALLVRRPLVRWPRMHHVSTGTAPSRQKAFGRSPTRERWG